MTAQVFWVCFCFCFLAPDTRFCLGSYTCVFIKFGVIFADFHVSKLFCLQPSSTLSGYVSACAYSPSNQYGVYSGPPGGYVAPGHHHWQAQSPALSHPGGGMSMHAGEIHSPMTFKHQGREGIHHYYYYYY